MSRLMAYVFAIGVLAVTTPSIAQEFKAGSITVEHPWSRPTPGGAQVGAGYLTIDNSSDTADRLLSASAEIAGRTQIHQMSMADGMMKMREITDGVDVPAKASLTLAPSAYHLMFLDLKKPLKEGDTFAGTLTFEKAGTVNVTFKVEKAGGEAPMPDDHHH